MSTHGKKGYDVDIQIGGVRVAHAQEGTPKYAMKTTPTTSMDTGGWDTHLTGIKSWGMDIKYLLIADDDAQRALLNAYIDGEKVTVQWRDEDGNGLTGTASITGWSPAGMNLSDAIAVSVSLEGDGAPAEVGDLS